MQPAGEAGVALAQHVLLAAAGDRAGHHAAGGVIAGDDARLEPEQQLVLGVQRGAHLGLRERRRGAERAAGVAAADAPLPAHVEPARDALERREDRREHLLDGHRMPARRHRRQLGLDHGLVELARVGLDGGGEAAALAQPDDRVAPGDVELERLEAPA